MTDVKHAESSQLPSDTTPTWEMELLVSGATTIGLLQLPGLLDKAYFSILNRSSEDVADLLQFLWLYSKISLITLIVTFVLHLCLRGYWVALVGMNSVYPGGVRWQNLRLGPIARQVSERCADDAARDRGGGQPRHPGVRNRLRICHADADAGSMRAAIRKPGSAACWQ